MPYILEVAYVCMESYYISIRYMYIQFFYFVTPVCLVVVNLNMY